MNLEAYRVELDTGHPDTGAYSLDNTIATAEVNLENRNKKRPTVGGEEIFNATDDTEYDNLIVADPVKGLEDQNQWLVLCQTLEVDTADGVAKALEKRIFGPGTQTRANLAALQNPPASRAIEIDLGKPRVGDTERARAL